MKKVIGVLFEDGRKEYSYFTDIEVEVGEFVIVVVGDIPKIVQVRSTHLSDAQQSKANKWIAGKVDLTEYYKKAQKQQLIQEVERELDEQMKKVQRYEMFKACASSSPKMRELLGKLNELDPELNLIEEANPAKEEGR